MNSRCFFYYLFLGYFKSNALFFTPYKLSTTRRLVFPFIHFLSFFSFFANVFSWDLNLHVEPKSKIEKENVSHSYSIYIFSSPSFPPSLFCTLALPSFFFWCKIQSILQIYFLSSAFAFAAACKMCWRRILMTSAWWELNVWSSKRFAHHSSRQSNSSSASTLRDADNGERNELHAQKTH